MDLQLDTQVPMPSGSDVKICTQRKSHTGTGNMQADNLTLYSDAGGFCQTVLSVLRKTVLAFISETAQRLLCNSKGLRATFWEVCCTRRPVPFYSPLFLWSRGRANVWKYLA